ncbi:glutathione S-transferase family protein [Minwuia sp.]|uniref:glutathione S-transferase family protein n=1 Tax=Minwuia sp. TaxID=2493630 RepID=UPI003A8F5BD4
MTYVLINRQGSGGFVVEAALAMARVDYRVELLDSPVSTPLPESFAAINPWRQVPVLDLPDGTRMTESAAMLIHLAGAHPEAGIAPAPGDVAHPAFLRWTLFIATTIYEAMLRRTYPERIIADPDQHDAVRASANARMKAAFDLLEGELAASGYLCGDRLSVADVYLAMLYFWFDRSLALPRCGALVSQVRDDPVTGPIWKASFER